VLAINATLRAEHSQTSLTAPDANLSSDRTSMASHLVAPRPKSVMTNLLALEIQESAERAPDSQKTKIPHNLFGPRRTLHSWKLLLIYERAMKRRWHRRHLIAERYNLNRRLC
jgi:hypothetical protein